jgi:predicted transcriptional regulator
MPSTKAFTVRLPADLYHTSSELARRRQVSLNALIQEALAAILKAEEVARLYEAFGELGEDAEEASVEYALPAQWEILRRGNS